MSPAEVTMIDPLPASAADPCAPPAAVTLRVVVVHVPSTCSVPAGTFVAPASETAEVVPATSVPEFDTSPSVSDTPDPPVTVLATVNVVDAAGRTVMLLTNCIGAAIV